MHSTPRTEAICALMLPTIDMEIVLYVFAKIGFLKGNQNK